MTRKIKINLKTRQKYGKYDEEYKRKKLERNRRKLNERRKERRMQVNGRQGMIGR